MRWITMLMVSLLLVSCGEKENTPEEHTEASLFETGKGLLLSKESLESMGVQTAKAETRSVAATLSATAQVYRGADEKTSHNGNFRNGFTYASAALPVASLDFVQRKSRVAVSMSGHPETSHSAHITRFDESLSAATSSVEALLEIPDETNAFPMGTFLTVTFTSEQSRPVLAIPIAALLKNSEGNFAYVVNGDRLLRTAVKVGGEDSGWIEIKEGLQPDSVIAIHGAEALWLAELRATKGGGGED